MCHATWQPPAGQPLQAAPTSPCCSRVTAVLHWLLYAAPSAQCGLLAPILSGAVAYLKGLLTAGEVASAARQAPDRQLTRILVDTLQQRVDAGGRV